MSFNPEAEIMPMSFQVDVILAMRRRGSRDVHYVGKTRFFFCWRHRRRCHLFLCTGADDPGDILGATACEVCRVVSLRRYKGLIGVAIERFRVI